ncbi:MAG: cyclic peptide export ABC transporter [Chloroflexota bacterium]
MKLVRFLFGVSKRAVFFSLMAGVVAGACGTGLVALITMALNQQLTSEPTFAWIFFGVCALLLLSSVFSQVLLIRLAQDTILKLRLSLSRQILATPLHQLERIGTHRLLSMLTDDISMLATTIVIVPAIAINVVVVISSLFYIGWLSWHILVMVGVFMVIGIVSYQFPIVYARDFLRRGREEQDILFGHIESLVSGVKELQLNRWRRIAFFSQDLEQSATTFNSVTKTGFILFTVIGQWGQLLLLVVIGLLLLVIPALDIANTMALTGSVLAVLYLLNPMTVILNHLPNLSRAVIILNKVEQLGLSLTASQEEILQPLASEKTDWQSLSLVNVTHHYYHEQGDSNFILGPINLTFHPGEIVFLVGGNGSGKTTLAKLITGLYTPQTGSIYLDTQPVISEQQDLYRQLFAVIFSDFYLFQRLPSRQNQALDDQAQEYLTMLQLDHKVQVENGQLSTLSLSQGQRKRLALLAAYLEDRPFYIFDEWAADQDPIFKEVFYTQILLNLKRQGKTLLVITHDDKYFRLADRIIRLDYGKITSDTVNEDQVIQALYD